MPAAALPDRPYGGPTWILLARSTSLALGLISAPVIARAIGPDGRGETAAVLSLAYLLPIILAAGVPFEVRRQIAAGQDHSVIIAARWLALISLVPSLTLAGALWATYLSQFDPIPRLVAAMVLALAPLSISWMCDNSTLVAQQRFLFIFLLQLVQPSIYLAGVVLLWMTQNASVSTVLIASGVGNAATAGLGWIFVRPSTNRGKAQPFKLLRSSVPYWGSAAAEAASNRLDQVFALPLMGAHQAGLYSVAASIGGIPIAIAHAISGAYFARIVQASPESRVSLVGAAVRDSSALAIVSGLIGAVATPFLVPLLFGADFGGAVLPTLVLLATASLPVTLFTISQSLGAVGMGHRMAAVQVASLVAGITMLWLLGPDLGATGASIAASAGSLVGVVGGIRFLGLSASQWFVRPRDLRFALDLLLGGFSDERHETRMRAARIPRNRRKVRDGE